jgi:hypothetical protein
MVWTEGTTEHAVRAQTLGPAFQALGDPFTVSPAGVNAGQGSVAVAGGNGIVAFLETGSAGFELWGATFKCP